MEDRPEGISDQDVATALADGWGLDVRSVTYRPVGFGSYHWAVDAPTRPLFATVDALRDDPAARLRELRAAMGTALALHCDAGLEFVVAPVPSVTGEPLLPLGERHTLAVFPEVEGTAGEFGPHRDEDRSDVLDLLVRLHAAGADAPPTDLLLPGRDGLDDALAAVGRPWGGGPYAEPARALLADRAAHVRGLLAEFDRLTGEVRRDGSPWVVTHGEPHPGNVIRGRDGLHLVDWDTVRLAPPERDVWMLGADAALLASYTRATGRPLSPAALALYPLWWTLADVAAYVALFRGPHRSTPDVRSAFTYLSAALPA
ncbi:phosphotransferase [Actinacidiphila rubida]|uniref:Spectinomycin phosphotransferase n=1 Tax=Actinacidiphila rubida TaxID=310780 RepID=A0A1H8SU76_9ACTN|nr:phosphotransferase [Actinacidiphila rubida]SEO82036.1 spectinomycin phosphotransferase [Actinacidiphila rubida]